MLQILALTQDNIIATRATDIPQKNDYSKIEPLIHNVISNGKKVRWYFEMEGKNTARLKDFLKNGATEIYYGSMHLLHANDIDKIALVGTKEWEVCMRMMMHTFIKAAIMYFDWSQKEQAWEWLTCDDKKNETTAVTK